MSTQSFISPHRERMMRLVCAVVVTVFLLGTFAGGWGLSLVLAQPLVQIVGLGPLMLVTGFAALAAAYWVFVTVLRWFGIDINESNEVST